MAATALATGRQRQTEGAAVNQHFDFLLYFFCKNVKHVNFETIFALSSSVFSRIQLFKHSDMAINFRRQLIQVLMPRLHSILGLPIGCF